VWKATVNAWNSGFNACDECWAQKTAKLGGWFKKLCNAAILLVAES